MCIGGGGARALFEIVCELFENVTHVISPFMLHHPKDMASRMKRLDTWIKQNRACRLILYRDSLTKPVSMDGDNDVEATVTPLDGSIIQNLAGEKSFRGTVFAFCEAGLVPKIEPSSGYAGMQALRFDSVGGTKNMNAWIDSDGSWTFTGKQSDMYVRDALTWHIVKAYGNGPCNTPPESVKELTASLVLAAPPAVAEVKPEAKEDKVKEEDDDDPVVWVRRTKGKDGSSLGGVKIKKENEDADGDSSLVQKKKKKSKLV
jgi:hypothetical protein